MSASANASGWGELADIVGMWCAKDLGAGLVLFIEGRTPIAVHLDSPPQRTPGPPVAVVR